MKPMISTPSALTRKLTALLLPAVFLLPLAGASGARPAKKRSPPKTSSAPAASSSSSGGALWTPPAAAPDDSGDPSAKPTTVAAGDSPPEPGSPPKALSAPKAAGGEAKESAPAPPPAGGSADLERLRADYDRLRDDLFRARSRAQIVEDGLYKSKLGASFRWKGAPSFVVHHAAIRLDGGEIWDSGDKPVTDDLIKVAERGVKPGPHAISLRLDIRPGTKKSKDSDKLGYTSEHTFAIIVPDGLRTHVAITGDEDGNLPEYEPKIEVELESEK
jgi:hypothetical protein